MHRPPDHPCPYGEVALNPKYYNHSSPTFHYSKLDFVTSVATYSHVRECLPQSHSLSTTRYARCGGTDEPFLRSSPSTRRVCTTSSSLTAWAAALYVHRAASPPACRSCHSRVSLSCSHTPCTRSAHCHRAGRDRVDEPLRLPERRRVWLPSGNDATTHTHNPRRAVLNLTDTWFVRACAAVNACSSTWAWRSCT
jgi:hypothetical protein